MLSVHVKLLEKYFQNLTKKHFKISFLDKLIDIMA